MNVRNRRFVAVTSFPGVGIGTAHCAWSTCEENIAYGSQARVPDDHHDDIANLAEWIDLAGFILSEEIERDRQKSERRRLYNDIHKHVAEMERQGLTVLIGIMDAPQPQFPDAQVAILAITTKATDPGAVKREHIWVDRRNVSNLRFEVADEDT